MMAGFNLHSVCAHCRDKKKGQDTCVEKPGSDCLHCNALTSEQLAQLSTPSYKTKKEKRDLKSRIHHLLITLSVPPLWTRHLCQ